ncbi:BsuPI-related putative proteinase inhibitor [Bacillus sp. KH172YL63]|uniref:BsuPI-related putative proteinase inhibitor n=1 Tax=Bacillus sp. KH172YL63 TaxID=2709784 RepID=UPI0013E4553E|nr:BsuPI-related putative proteinase inhibitor [Bacillus sp. KH172YL63]BCB02073.1 hypothetical protein KH172YL63_02060 [Bacillus sp. KH172YL63]
MLRWVFVSFILIAGMAGCGKADDQPEEQSSPQQQTGDAEETSGQKGIVAGAMEPSLTKESPNVYVYTVKNQTEREKTFVFSSGQTIDFELKNEKGEVVYKDSDNKMYTQAIQEITIIQGEEFSQKVAVPELESGTYTLTVWLTAKGEENYKATAEIVVE